MKNDTNLVWLDLEMTGLDANKDKILEIATIVTDAQLNILAEGPVFAIKQPNRILTSMDKWNTNQHGKSGLIDRVKTSAIAEEKAEKETLKFIKKFVDKNRSPLCGNSVYQDRIFLKKYMPTLEKYFHYRLIDVSTIKELTTRWGGKPFEKESKHQALSDIKDSIAELKYYRQTVFAL